jgi:6-phosphogluconolactonase (cycloisomerase 2 family)
MTKQVRTGLMLIVAMAVMGLASCGHYTCGVTFGNSTCAGGPVSLNGGTGSADAAFLFVSDGTASPGSIQGYTLDTNVNPPTLKATTSYTPPSTPGNDSGMGMAVAQKKFLYTAFGSNGQIFGWTISTTGILSAVQGSPYTVSPLFGSGFSSVFDTHRVITNPAGTLLFIGDEGGSRIYVYQIGSAGALTAVAGSPFPAPFAPGYMTTDGLGNFLYFTDSLTGHTGTEIAGFSIGSGSSLGVLTAIPGSFVGPPFDMWQVEGEPTGKFLIGTKGMSLTVNGADDKNLYVFSIAAASGAIIQVGAAVPTTYSPMSIAVQSNAGGNLVYTFGYDDAGTGFNAAEVYTISSSGTLSALNQSPFSIAALGSEGQFDQSGGFLFEYGGIFNTNTVIYNVTFFDVVAGQPTLPTPEQTYGGFWVATDAP